MKSITESCAKQAASACVIAAVVAIALEVDETGAYLPYTWSQ